jgi:hypothetical protein
MIGKNDAVDDVFANVGNVVQELRELDPFLRREPPILQFEKHDLLWNGLNARTLHEGLCLPSNASLNSCEVIPRVLTGFPVRAACSTTLKASESVSGSRSDADGFARTGREALFAVGRTFFRPGEEPGGLVFGAAIG